jgi:ankyrin repeat protein
MKQRQTIEQILKWAHEALFPAGADKPTTIHSRNSDGDTPLHIAALRGDRHAINCLLDAGAKIDAKGDMSNTPLYYTVMGDHLLAAESLLERGADPDALSELGFTPRSLAEHHGVKEMIRLFKGRVRA